MTFSLMFHIQNCKTHSNLFTSRQMFDLFIVEAVGYLFTYSAIVFLYEFL